MLAMLVTVVFGFLALAAVTSGEEQNTNRWDNVDVDKVLKNERLLRTYFRCVMDQGKCSPDAAELKKNIPEVFVNECTKCTENQKANVDKVMKHLYEKRQDLFVQLEKKFDPEGSYRRKYQESKEKKATEKIEVKS